MRIEETSVDAIRSLGYLDLMIVALGQESRASFLASKLSGIKIREKLCILLTSEVNEREKDALSALGFSTINIEEFKATFDISKYTSILVDYSVMMKSLYAWILDKVTYYETKRNCLVYFSYTHAEFEEWEGSKQSVNRVELLFSNRKKKIARKDDNLLVLSLGYERLSAIGVIEYLEVDYENVIVFINKESESSPYYRDCLRHNENFLRLLRPNQIFELNFEDHSYIRNVIHSIVTNALNDNRTVIIAPIGMKLFSFQSMIIALEYSNVVFYNVSSKKNSKLMKKAPNLSRLPVIYQVMNS